MRIAFLWGVWQSPLDVCADGLAQSGHDVLAVATFADDRSPFPASRWRESYEKISTAEEIAAIRSRLLKFGADVWLCSGWHRPWIRDLIKSNRQGATINIVCFDNQFRGDLRQHAGRIAARRVVHRPFDRAFVPGDRQAQFARFLGFPSQHIATGLFIPDPRTTPNARGAESQRRSFLYLGAREPRKGFDTLLDAYELYRTRSSDPWGLVVGGSGPGVSKDGVQDLGFVGTVASVNAAFASSAASVMVGPREAWGIFLQEAAAAGHALIAAREVGATPHLVAHAHNGYIVAAGDVPGIAEAMGRVASSSFADLDRMGQVSRSLAAPFDFTSWMAGLESLL